MTRVFAIEFSGLKADTPRVRANEQTRTKKHAQIRAGRIHFACPACAGEGDAGGFDLCIPCEGTGVAASARYWD